MCPTAITCVTRNCDVWPKLWSCSGSGQGSSPVLEGRIQPERASGHRLVRSFLRAGRRAVGPGDEEADSVLALDLNAVVLRLLATNPSAISQVDVGKEAKSQRRSPPLLPTLRGRPKWLIRTRMAKRSYCARGRWIYLHAWKSKRAANSMQILPAVKPRLETIRDSQIKFGSVTAKVCAVSAAESWASFRFSLAATAARRRIFSPMHARGRCDVRAACLFLRSGHGYFSRPVKSGADVVEPVSKERHVHSENADRQNGPARNRRHAGSCRRRVLGRAAIEPTVCR